MGKEAEERGEKMTEEFKGKIFASAFGSFNPAAALKQYYDWFEPPPEPEYEEFIPEDEDDIREMINQAKRAGLPIA